MSDMAFHDIPEPTKEESDAMERDFIQSAWEAVEEYEHRWRAEGRAVAWIDPHPQWCDLCDWDMYALAEPDHVGVRTIRFAMLGGGQIRVRELLLPNKDHLLKLGHDFRTCQACLDQHRYGTQVQIKAETRGGLVNASGWIEGFHYEMNMDAILLPERHQHIADRAAKTLRLIGDANGYPDKDNFLALLDGSQGCAFCHRPLRDEVSKLIGIGPDCAKQNGIAHNKAAADAVLIRRHALFGKIEA